MMKIRRNRTGALDRRMVNKRAIALLFVGLMLIVPFSLTISATSDSEASSSVIMPVMKDYAYAMKYDTSNGSITGVWKDENIKTIGGAGKAEPVNVKNPGSKGVNGDWGFTDGLGPFNTFYAAINLTKSASDANGTIRMNSGIGQIGFILNPSNLEETLSGGSYTFSDYNIMFVIPTVYWYSDYSNGILYMSNTNNNSCIPSAINEQMFPYAHSMTGSSGAGDDVPTCNTFPYVALGVYEAYYDGDSQTVWARLIHFMRP